MEQDDLPPCRSYSVPVLVLPARCPCCMRPTQASSGQTWCWCEGEECDWGSNRLSTLVWCGSEACRDYQFSPQQGPNETSKQARDRRTAGLLVLLDELGVPA